MGLKLGNLKCLCCGRECAICDTNQVPEYLDIEFDGLADVYCNVQITCPDPGTTSSTLILPLSSINGTHRLTLDRTITETYYPDGEPASSCTAIYVGEIIPFGDAFVGAVSGCDGSTAPFDDEDKWYRDATVQLIASLNDERIIIGSICDTSLDPADPSFLILANSSSYINAAEKLLLANTYRARLLYIGATVSIKLAL